jgi:hypothetical protein
VEGVAVDIGHKVHVFLVLEGDGVGHGGRGFW